MPIICLKNSQEGYTIAAESITSRFKRLLMEMEELEKRDGRFRLVLAEILKDEINANDEENLYNGIIRILREYHDNEHVSQLINEITAAVSGGATMEEIIRISMDETVNPTIASEIMIDADE